MSRAGFSILIMLSAVLMTPGVVHGVEFGIGENHFDLGGFIGVGTAARLTSPDDLRIGFDTWERPSLVSQVNKARLSVYSTHPKNISALVAVDLLYTSEPRRPFNDRGEVQLDEAYVDFMFRDAEIRLGLQKVIWGKSDLISPFDILTSRDLMDPFLFPTLEDRIAQPGVRVNLSRGEYNIETVFFPVWLRSRVPLAETDKGSTTRADEWFPSMAVYPYQAFLIDDPNLSWLIFIPTYHPLKEPDKDLSTASFGIKVNTLKGEYDLDFYLVSTMDPMPTADITTVFAQGTIPDLGLNDPGLLITLDGNAEFTRVTTIGAAGARTLGPLALRSEMAVLAGKQYFRLFDPQATEEALNELDTYGIGQVRGEPKSHTEFMWITGVDYEIPGLLIFTSSQLAITRRFSHEDFYTQAASDVDLSFLLQKGFQDDHFMIAFAGLAGLRSKAVWLSPTMSYIPPVYEDIQVSARLNVFTGDDFSKIGMYGDESSFVVSLRWLF